MTNIDNLDNSGWIQFTPTYAQKFAWWQFIKRYKHRKLIKNTSAYMVEGKTVHFKIGGQQLLKDRKSK